MTTTETSAKPMPPWFRRVRITEDGCWHYGNASPDRYNTIRGRTAHKVSWEYFYGPVPDGMWVLHTCDYRPCVNPAHLFLGPPKSNTIDMMAKGRNRRLRHVYADVPGCHWWIPEWTREAIWADIAKGPQPEVPPTRVPEPRTHRTEIALFGMTDAEWTEVDAHLEARGETLAGMLVRLWRTKHHG